METETLDKLYLEISQFTKAKTGDQAELESLLARATITQRDGNGELAPTVSLIFEEDIHARRMFAWLEKQRAQ